MLELWKYLILKFMDKFEGKFEGKFSTCKHKTNTILLLCKQSQFIDMSFVYTNKVSKAIVNHLYIPNIGQQ